MPMPELAKDLSRLSLDQIAQMAADTKLPPVDRWDPPLSGDSLIRIARDGRWYHDGGLIERENLVRLFATILRREADGGYVLVTPVEKQSVAVEDAPFMAVEVKSEGTGRGRTLAFRLNVGDMVIADADHPIRFDSREGEPAPYLAVRGGMEARIARAVFYELADLALGEANDPPGLWSGDRFFSMAALL